MLHKHSIFVLFTPAVVLLFLVRPFLHIWLISWKLMLSNPFSPCTTNSGTLQNLRGTNLPFQESIVSRTKQRSWKMYFFEVLLHYHILNGMLHKHLFLYFPHASVLLFLVRPSLYDSSAEIWCFLIHSHPVPLILEHYKTWEVQIFPFNNQQFQKYQTKKLKDVFLLRFSFIITFFMGCCISTPFSYFSL